MDEDAGGPVRVLGPEGDPLVDDHKDQVPEQADHEHQLRQQHQQHTAQLPKVPGEEEVGKPTDMTQTLGQKISGPKPVNSILIL